MSTTPLPVLPVLANFTAATATVSTSLSAGLPSCEGVQTLFGVHLVLISALRTSQAFTDEIADCPPLSAAWCGLRFQTASATWANAFAASAPSAATRAFAEGAAGGRTAIPSSSPPPGGAVARSGAAAAMVRRSRGDRKSVV